VNPLFVFLATAVADFAEGRRPGARHAMLIYVLAEDFEAAQRKAAGSALGAGWMLVRLEKGKEVERADITTDDAVLQSAMESAIDDGSAIVVYGDELPPEA
jgi:hypothetical protein